MSDVLEDAARVIHGPRRQAYGPVEESFDALAQVLSVVLRKKLKEPLTSREVGLMMISLKLCREANAHERDNLVDLAGYAALTERVSVKRKEVSEVKAKKKAAAKGKKASKPAMEAKCSGKSKKSCCK
jgi:hypothetical protein